MAPVHKVTTATLVRGALYTLRHYAHTPQNPKEALRFERDKPVVVDDPKIIAHLEGLHEETTDGDGEAFEKPVFRIDRNAATPEDAPSRARPTRLSATRTIKRRA